MTEFCRVDLQHLICIIKIYLLYVHYNPCVRVNTISVIVCPGNSFCGTLVVIYEPGMLLTELIIVSDISSDN